MFLSFVLFAVLSNHFFVISKVFLTLLSVKAFIGVEQWTTDRVSMDDNDCRLITFDTDLLQITWPALGLTCLVSS